MWVGAVLVVASTLGAAFSKTVSFVQLREYVEHGVLTAGKAVQVIMTQGFLYGVSSGLLFAPCVSFVDEWFLERRGLANGLL